MTTFPAGLTVVSRSPTTLRQRSTIVSGSGLRLVRNQVSLNRKDGNGKVLYGQQDWIGIDRAVHRYTGHRDESIDLACLDLRGMDTAGHDVPVLASGFLEKLDYERFGVGSDVLYAGYPNGMKDAQNGLALMRKGSIASIPELDCDGKGLIAIDGTVLEGNSGGPVFVSYDDKYRLLGVMQATSLVADDYGFAIKQEYVNELVADALEKSANERRRSQIPPGSRARLPRRGCRPRIRACPRRLGRDLAGPDRRARAPLRAVRQEAVLGGEREAAPRVR